MGVKEGGSGKEKAKQNGSVIVLLKRRIVLLDKMFVAKQRLYCVTEKAAAKDEVAWQQSGRITEG